MFVCLFKLILKRLLEVKPTRELSREQQLKDYYKNFASSGAFFYANTEERQEHHHHHHHNQNSSILTATSSKPLKLDQSRIGSTSASALSHHNYPSTSAPGSKHGSRPGSAKINTANSRISSAKSTSSNRSANIKHSMRPAWEDRW